MPPPRQHPTDPILYLLARFPSVTETFLYEEIEALERAGVAVETWALRTQSVPLLQPAAQRLHSRTGVPNAMIALAAFARWAVRAPRAMLANTAWAWSARPRGRLALIRHWGAWFLAPALAEEVEKRCVRHIHAAYLGPTATAARIASDLAALPFSASAHAHDIFKGSRGLETKILETTFLRTISEHNRRRLIALSPALTGHPIVVVPCGLSPDWFEPRKSGERAAQPTVLAVAQLESYKALDVLIDASAILNYRGVAHRVVIIGEGTRRDALQRRIHRHRLEGVVELTGARTSEEVRLELDRATLFAAPGREEKSGKKDGIPVAIAEAMARGVPVVASRISGIPELVHHRKTGLLVRPDDPGEMAHALEKLIGDPPLGRALSRRARDRVGRTRRSDACAQVLASCLRGRMPDSGEEADPEPAPDLEPAPSARGDAPNHTEIRCVGDDDADAVIDLFARTFGPREASSRWRRWRWLMDGSRSDPKSGDERRSFVVEKGNCIVGCMIVVPVPLWVHDRTVTVNWIGATALLPGHRGLGGLLMGKVREELHLSSGFPTARMLRFWRRVDRRRELLVPCSLRHWVRLLRRPGAAERWGFGPLGAIEDKAGELLGKAGGLRARSVEKIGDDWDAWLQGATRTWPITLARSVPLCNRLYSEDPVAPCEMVVVERRGHPAAFAAIDLYRGEDERLHAGLADLFAAESDGAALAFALHAAVRLARRRGATVLKALEPTHPKTRALLRAAGFLPGRGARYPLLLARAPNHVSSSWYADTTNWHLTRSWCDPRRY
ncbi:MAG: hypothetical protein CME06_06640 [Gemmatimonadetes bacterium]|nr:hypothetical protein [Gemmatimonadota bacterium]